MSYYKENFMHFSKLGFITRPRYLDVFLPRALRVAMVNLEYHLANLRFRLEPKTQL